MYPYRNQQIPAPFQKNIITPTIETASTPTVSIQKNNTAQAVAKQTTKATIPTSTIPKNSNSSMVNPAMALFSVLLLEQLLP
ncbi:MAG: hypothetical protein GX299_09170 [Epulopiscium sp.]|jgi:hypothetical protein|nr:hypothetical protein [Candidatus Epulonipiscium sp.]